MPNRLAITGVGLLVREQSTTLSARWSVDSVAATPSTGTITITRPDGSLYVDGATLALALGSVSYTTTPAAAEQLGEGWRIDWTVDGTTVRQRAAMVLYAVPSTVDASDLLARHPELSVQYPDGATTGERFVAVGEREVEAWLARHGKRPWLVVPDGALQEPTEYAALAAWFRSLSTGNDSNAGEKADYYDAKFEAAMASIKITVDETGENDIVPDKPTGPRVIFLTAPDRYPYGWRNE